MSETTYLKLFKHDNPSANENQFDVDKSLNDNWDKLDDFAGDVNEKVQEIEGNIAKQEQDIVYVKEELETEINELQKDIQANSIIEETEQAKSLYIEDASGARGKLTVEGNAEQETSTASANLLDTYLFEEKTVNGVTLTKKENGAIVLNGTATSQTLFEAKLKQTINKNGYIFKISKVSGTVSAGNIQFFLYADKYTANKNIAVTTNVNSANITLDNNTYTIERIVIPNGTVLSNVEINAMVSETDTSYVSFIPDTPSIDYPSTIKCLGDNKNELHMQEKETTQIGVIVKQQESILTLNGTTNAIGNLLNGNYVDIGTFKKGKYSFKVHISGNFERLSGNDFAFYIRKKSDTSKSYGVITGSTIEIGRNSFIFELTEDTDLVIQMFANASNIVFDNFEMKLKLEEGEIQTSYSPYEQGSTEIKIKNADETQIKSYILDIQQEMLSGDYFDLDRKKEVHGWNKKILTGTENTWQLYTTGTRRFGLDITGDLPKIITGKYGTGYCTHFKVLTTTGTDLTMFLQVEPNHFYIAIVDTNSRWSDVTALKNELQELYNANTPVTTYYKTAETTELDLTEAQIKALEQLNKLRFYKNVNNIFTLEDIALLQATYSVDIQTKLNNINNQLLEMGGN